MLKRKRIDCIRDYSSKKNCSLVGNQKLSDWDRCQDGFDISQSQRSPARKSFSNKKSKGRLLSSERLIGSQDDDIDISWSSSDDSDSDICHSLVFTSPDVSPRTNKKIFMHSIRKASTKTLPNKDEDRPSSSFQVTDHISGVSHNSEISDVLISDYESTSEDDADGIRENSNSQQTSESYSISSGSSSLPSSSLPSGVGGNNAKKGSNLMDVLKQQILSPQVPEENDPLDSAKKRSKFLTGGLADRLQKLISRERSSIAMWRHRAGYATNNTNTKSLTVCVQKVQVNCGIYISECLDVTNKEENDKRLLHVLFSTSTARQLRIAEGSIVKLYPPWQQLNLPNYSEPIILCTHYCQLVGQELDTTEQTAHTSTYQTVRRKMSFDTLPSNDPLPVKPILEEVTNPTDADTQASDSILDSIADSSGHNTTGMCIRATVQRVCCRQEPNNEKAKNSVNANQQWYVILQDIRGVFCELKLPSGCHGHNTWKEFLTCEGKTFIFQGAKVSQRTNRLRSVRLFSMLDSMWPPSDDVLQLGFNSQSDSSQGPRSLPAPSFCYTLNIDNINDAIKESIIQYTIYKPSKIFKLKDVSNMPSRFSVHAKVFYITPTDRQKLRRLYITDPSLQNSAHSEVTGDSSRCNTVDKTCFTYRCLLLEASCFAESRLVGNVFLFKDIFIENDDCLRADNYSRILEVEQSDVCKELQNFELNLKPFGRNSKQFELVTVQGLIVGADESTAYQWQVCNKCGSDKLHVVSLSNEKFYCEVCRIEIVSTCIRMFLEVYIECLSVKNAKVKVQLLQTSIENILPPITVERRIQGFDMQSIMGKQLGPITVIVRNAAQSPNLYSLDEIQI